MLVEALSFLLVLAGMAVSAAACEGVGGPELTTLSTSLSGESKEGTTITVLEGSKVKDKATLKGKNAATATGKVTYKVYSDSGCKTLVTTAGEVTVSGESIPASSEKELEGGASYYWQAHYTGDSKNAESTSECNEISTVKAKTTLSTTLSTGEHSSEELEILEGAKIKDKATLSGTNSSNASGTVKYDIYSESECKTLVAAAGEVSVTSGSVPASTEEQPKAGTYYWQATYSGDTLHQGSTSTCGKEVAKVAPPPRIEQVNFLETESVLVDHQKEVTLDEIEERITKHEPPPEESTAIDKFGGADEIEWKSPKAGEVTKNWPVAYPKGKRIELTIRLALEAPTQTFLEKNLAGEPLITGETSVAGAAISFQVYMSSGEIAAQLATHKTYLEPAIILASTNLPNEVRYDPMSIKWKWKVQEKASGTIVEQALGTSTHNLYLTYSKSIGPIYFSLLSLETEGIEEVSTTPTEAQAIEGVWKVFSTVGFGNKYLTMNYRIYNPASGEIKIAAEWLRYYQELPTTSKNLEEYFITKAKTKIMAEEFGLTTTAELLQFLTGDCNAWQEAFENALDNEGIVSEPIKAVVKFKIGVECVELTEKCSMLVDNWKFEGAAEEGFAYNENRVVDLNGAFAQGLENPPSLFENHQLVAVKNALYDPSYGTGPTAGPFGLEGPLGLGGEGESIRMEYQEKYIAGFCKKNPGTGKYKCAKAVAGDLELQFE